MNLPAKLSDLIDALEFESVEFEMYFDRQTGRIISLSEHIRCAVEEGREEELTDLPDWQKDEVEIAQAIVNDTEDRFIAPPSKFDFHEYRHMERFIQTLPQKEAADELWKAIKGHGAFRYFKDTLYRLGLQEAWYSHRNAAMKKFVIGWAEANDVPYEDNTRDPRSS